MLTGSYRDENCLELWDLRKYEKTHEINWNGPYGKLETENYIQDSESLEIEEKLLPPKTDEDADEEKEEEEK